MLNDIKNPPKMVDGYYQALSGYNYTFTLYPERKCFNMQYRLSIIEWFRQTWLNSFFYAFIYILTVFFGRYWMKNREKYDLRRALIAWNVSLAVFSIMGTIRVWPEFIYVLRNHGVIYSLCSNEFSYGVVGCWTVWFNTSKFAELIDTLFVVLRKQPLHFLHWYHHATVLIYCWYSVKDITASGRWFVVMNFTIHAVMYSYYACRALRYQIPKYISILITCGQISQMVVGIYINTVAYTQKKSGNTCHVSYENITFSFLMYASYFLLFCKFFYTAYVSKSNKKKDVPKSKIEIDGVNNGKDAFMYSISSASKIHTE